MNSTFCFVNRFLAADPRGFPTPSKKIHRFPGSTTAWPLQKFNSQTAKLSATTATACEISFIAADLRDVRPLERNV